MLNLSNTLQVGFLLSDTARILRRIIDKRARAIGMSRAQWAVLSRISRNEGLRQVDLAAEMEMEPISVARIIDKLQAADLVERRPDPDDRRAYRLHLLPAAGPVLEQVRAIGSSVLEPVLADFEPSEVDALVATLEGIRADLLSLETSGNEHAGQDQTDSAA
jgi:MarR family transcriptional regulator, transcriptional regulator for hemolysin